MAGFKITCDSCESLGSTVEFASDGTEISCDKCEALAVVDNWFDWEWSTIPFKILCQKCGSAGEIDHSYICTDETGPVGGSCISCVNQHCSNEHVLADV